MCIVLSGIMWRPYWRLCLRLFALFYLRIMWRPYWRLCLRLFVVLSGVMWRPYWRLCLRLFALFYLGYCGGHIGDFVLDYLHCFIWGNVAAILETLS